MSLVTPDKIRTLQRALYVKAKQEPTRRFHFLYDKVWRGDILAHAYALSRANGGAPGVDGETFARIEDGGVGRWLGELREDIRTGRYKPQPVRRVMIPKSSGVGQRPLGIPTIRDRVVQTAATLVLEPIFEADFDEAAYGYRRKRSALDAVQAVHKAINEGHTDIVDADLSRYFDSIPHAALMQCVARRLSDGKMLHLIKMWLKTPVEETDERGTRRMRGGQKTTRGTPQGGVASPLMANIYMHRYIKAFRKYGLDCRVRGGVGDLRRRFRGPVSAWCRGGPRDDAAMDDRHRARAERGQDACVQRPMRVLRLPRLHLRPDVLAANRRTL